MPLECWHSYFYHSWIYTLCFQSEWSFFGRWDDRDIRESTGYASRPACKGAPQAEIAECKSASGFPYSLFFLTLFCIPPGSPSLMFLGVFFALKSNQVNAVFHIFQQPSSILFVPGNLLVYGMGMRRCKNINQGILCPQVVYLSEIKSHLFRPVGYCFWYLPGLCQER